MFSYGALTAWTWFTEGFDTIELKGAKTLLDELGGTGARAAVSSRLDPELTPISLHSLTPDYLQSDHKVNRLVYSDQFGDINQAIAREKKSRA
jgi:hypothetical protein